MTRTHQAGVVVPPNATNALPDLLLGDLAKMNYDLDWFEEIFTNGRVCCGMPVESTALDR